MSSNTFETEMISADSIIIFITGFFEAAAIVKLRTFINELLEDGKIYIVLDMEKVTSINSTAIGLLLTCLKSVRQKNGTLELRNLQPSIEKTFSIMGADKIFIIDKK